MDDGTRSLPRGSPAPAWEVGTLIALTAAALAVRWLAIEHRELWLDEAFTAVIARSEGWGELLRMVAADNHPPLYFLGMRVWVLAKAFLTKSHRLGPRLDFSGFAVWSLQPVAGAGPAPPPSRGSDGIVPP